MPAWGAPTPLAKRQLQPPAVVRSFAQPRSGGGVVRQASAPQTAAATPLTAQQLGWQLPPIPTGAANPIREIELNAGKRGLGNTLEDLLTKDSRGAANYDLEEGEVKRGEGEQQEEHDKDVQQIASSYQKLGTRQAEQANGAGVLRGGALLQAAAKRAANEGKSREPVDQALTRQKAGDDRERGKIAVGRQQEHEDIAKEAARAEREEAQFGIDTQTLEGDEASANGYISPVSHLSEQPGAGFVRVGGPLKANPAAAAAKRRR